MDKKHVLLVAGDDRDRVNLTGVLKDRGLQVSAVASADEALALFVPGTHDVLLCDLTTPNLDGHTLLAGVRQCCGLTPVVLLTTEQTIDKAVAAVRGGAQHFIVKPVTADELEMNIEEAIENVRIKMELTRHRQELESLVEERTDRLEYTNRQLRALNQASHRLNQLQSEEQLLEAVPRLLTEALDFDRAILWLYRNQQLELGSFSFEKDSDEMKDNFRKSVKQPKGPMPPHLMECIEQKESVFIPDLNADPRWPRAAGEVIRTKAVLMVPVVCQDQGIGAISVNMQHHERVMDDQDIARVETFASMVGLALDNVRNYQFLEDKVRERTSSLELAKQKANLKASELEDAALQLGQANVELLTAHEELEAKQAQTEKLLDQLSRGRDELRAILDSRPDVVMMVNADGVITIANQCVEDWFGLRMQEVVGQNLAQFAESIADHFEEPDSFMRKLVGEADSQESPWLHKKSTAEIFEDALRTVGPDRKDILVGWLPVKERPGEAARRVWLFNDVTTLRSADEQLRTIIDASPIPIIVTRVADGEIIYANRHLARVIGLSVEELVGLKSPDFYTRPEDRQKVVGSLERDGYLENFEVSLKRANGEEFWSLFSLAITDLAGEKVIIGGVLDISDMKEAEEKLKLYRRIFDSSQDGILVFDTEGGLVTRNPAHEKMTGLTDDEVAGKKLMELVPPEARAKVGEQMQAFGSFRGEVVWPTKKGPDAALDLSVFPINGPDGKPVYAVGMGRDISERKRLEQSRHQAMAELGKAHDELKTAQTKLIQSEKMASLGLLVAGIAHEINTPVGAIGSMHDTLVRAVDKLKGSLTTCQLEACELDRMTPVLNVIDDANRVIKEGTERVTTIVRRLRSFARLDEADLKEVNIHDGIEDTLALINHEIKNRIEVVREFGDIPPITVFPGRLNQVFLNLLNNARQAIEGKGTITISTSVADGWVMVKMSDSGRGIKPDALKKIFDPGFTTKGVGVGTGLGLSICYQIIEDHRGRIEVESQLGEGTTFTIHVPSNLDELLDKKID